MPSSDIVLKSWQVMSDDKIFHRTQFACGVYQNRFSVIVGGHSDEKGLSSALMYDFEVQKSIPLPDLPFEGRCFGAIIGHSFYVFDWQGKMHRINLQTRTEWERIAHVTVSEICAVVADEIHLYIFSYDGKLDRYDPETYEFKQMPPMPTERYGFVAAVVDHQIFGIGGFFEEEDCIRSTVEVFNTKSESWNKAPSLPATLDDASATVIDRFIVVTAKCSDDSGNKSQALVLDTLKQEWTLNHFVLSPPREDHRCVTVGSRIISIGGEYRRNKYCPVQAINIKLLVLGWEKPSELALLQRLIDDGCVCKVEGKNKVGTITSKNRLPSTCQRYVSIICFLLNFVSFHS